MSPPNKPIRTSSRVAIFFEEFFPYRERDPNLSPKYETSLGAPKIHPTWVREGLLKLGIRADFISADQLRDPRAFNADKYDVLVWVYGSTFPIEAVRNLIEYHRSGGCIFVPIGVPFAIPCVKLPDGEWLELGYYEGKKRWEFLSDIHYYDSQAEKWFSHLKIGTGGFREIDCAWGFKYFKEADPIGLNTIKWEDIPFSGYIGRYAALLDPETLPPEDEVIGIVGVVDWDGELKGYSTVIIKHHCDRFKGAIDIWGLGSILPVRLERNVLMNMIIKSILYLLKEKGLVSEYEKLRRRVDEQYPTVQMYKPVIKVGKTHLFPRSNRPSKTLYVIDTVSKPEPYEYCATVLQGLVNRRQPRIYLIHRVGDKWDKFWLNLLVKKGFQFVSITLDEAIEKFKSEISGAVIYDPQLEPSGLIGERQERFINVISMICSVKNAIPLPEDWVEKYDLPIIFDARDKWKTPYEAYKWAFDSLWPEMNHSLLASLNPCGAFNLVDYLVEFKVFTVWFGFWRTREEEELLAKILSSTPPNTPVIGCWWGDWRTRLRSPWRKFYRWRREWQGFLIQDSMGEREGVIWSSRFAKINVPTCTCSNLSVHTGLPVTPLKQKRAKRKVKLEKDKIYVTIVATDGDNIGGFIMNAGLRFWEFKRVGVPINWSFSPIAMELAPIVAQYYYEIMSDDDLFIMGNSGVGYVYPCYWGEAYGEHRDDIYREYIELINEYLEKNDMRIIWVDGSDKRSLREMCKYIKADAVFLELVKSQPYERSHMIIEGKPCFYIMSNTPTPDNLKMIAPKERPAFLFVTIHPSLINEKRLSELKKLEEEGYVFVNAEEFVRLYKEAMSY